MAEDQPPRAGFPTEGMEATLLLVVGDIERSVAFYRDVLGAELYREYGGTSAVVEEREELRADPV